MGMGMHGNNHPQGKRTVILMVVLCLFLHFLLIPIWMGLVFANTHESNSFLKGPMYTKVVTCDTFDNITQKMVLVNQFPFLWADGNSLRPDGNKLDSTFIIAYDNKEKKWTMLETFTGPSGALIACVLGEGNEKININPEILLPIPGTDL